MSSLVYMQHELFEKRFENGYDIYTLEYLHWVREYHPESIPSLANIFDESPSSAERISTTALSLTPNRHLLQLFQPPDLQYISTSSLTTPTCSSSPCYSSKSTFKTPIVSVATQHSPSTTTFCSSSAVMCTLPPFSTVTPIPKSNTCHSQTSSPAE